MRKKYLMPELADNLDKIKKNIDFCTEKGVEKELQKGGRYYKKFSELVENTADCALSELYMRLSYVLPDVVREKEDTEFSQFADEYMKMLEDLTDPYLFVLKTVIKTGRHEQITSIFSVAIRQYITEYSKLLKKIA